MKERENDAPAARRAPAPQAVVAEAGGVSRSEGGGGGTHVTEHLPQRPAASAANAGPAAPQRVSPGRAKQKLQV